LFLGGVKELFINNTVMQAIVYFIFMPDFTNIKRIAKNLIKVATG
jgi:hypothetical protein